MRRAIVVLYVASFFFYGHAFGAGSGAYRLEVPDAEAMGKGSAFVAQASNPAAIYYNPAGITQLKGDNYISVGTTIIQPFMTYKDNAGSKTRRHDQVFIVPHTYFVSDFGMKKLAFGVGATSPWGLGTQWPDDSFSRYVSTKADMTAEEVMLVGAYKVNDQFSLGVSFDYTSAKVNKKKQLAQLGGPDGTSQLKGEDNNIWGYRLSALYRPNDRHSFGLMYRSAKDVKYRGKLYLTGLTGDGFNYEHIFGDSTSYQTDVSAKSRLPQSIVAGYSYKPSNKWIFETDVEWMDWSSTKQEYVTYESETDPTRLFFLGIGNPAPRDWRGVFSYSFGVEYKVNEKWSLRSGYFYHKNPIPEANFDTVLPDSDSNSVTAGVGHSFNDKLRLDFAYAAMFYRERTINTGAGISTGTNIDGKYSQFVNLYMVTLGYKF
ncbi:MAG TPA: OmpP1/FadL family transporter [Patescibacteria group bacterium]|nr:OmpP1/FadL family transporter [Patescibacteria group bacterium]